MGDYVKVAIIPAFNEENTIGSVVLRTKRHVDKVIVVDDGSKDKTAEVARLAGARVAKHIRNGGKGIALRTGFEVAENLHPDIVVCLDADAQHNPDDIPMVMAPIISGEADMVIGSRFLDKEHKKYIPKYRRLGQWVLTTTTNFGSDTKITDSQSGFRAFSGDILGKFKFRQNGFSVESEMIEDANDNEIKIKEVPISARYDGLDTSTEKPGKHGLGVLGFIIKTVKDRRPLLFFGVTGAILLLIGLVLGVYSLDRFFNHGYLPFGPSLVASMLILMGALSVFAGLILSSISGMIQGQKLLNHRQGGTLLEDIDEQKNQASSSHHPEQMLIEDIEEKKTPGQAPSSLHRAEMLSGDIDENKIQGLTASSHPREEMLLEDIDEKKIHM